jgi:hypothetical protein
MRKTLKEMEAERVKYRTNKAFRAKIENLRYSIPIFTGGSGISSELLQVDTFDDLPELQDSDNNLLYPPGTRAHVMSHGWVVKVAIPEAWGLSSYDYPPQWVPDSHLWYYPPNNVWPS